MLTQCRNFLNKDLLLIMKDLQRFILVGGPASGKGTQARYISSAFNLQSLSTGAMLRREIEECTEVGHRAQSYMDKAMFVPDDVVNDVVRGWLARSDDAAWLLDGYPRTVAQAETLENFLAERGLQVDVVVWLDVARELIESRILRRRECSKCSYVTQDAYDLCPDCGAKLQSRKDDNLEAFVRRWKDYEQMTLPVARYFESKGKVVKVSVTEEVEPEVVSRILGQKLNAYMAE